MFDNTNNYTLRKELIAGFTHYYVSFEDGAGKQQETKVPRTVYLEFRRFVKQERTLRRRDERYIEQSALTQETLHKRAVSATESVEDAVCSSLRDERLRQALGELPGIQRRRLYLHYALGFTISHISEMERCSTRAVEYSISIAKVNFLKKFQK